MNENLAYDYDIPEELIDGQPVAMSPRPMWRHIAVSGNLYHIFSGYLWKKPCTPIPDGMDLYLSNRDHFIPDMMVVCEKDKIKGDAVYGAPSLVVEVLSSSTAKRDRGYKKTAYEAAGVKEYWIIDPVGKSIEAYILEEGKFRLDEVYSLYPEESEKLTEEERAAFPKAVRCSLFPDLEIPLEDIFWRLQ